MGKTVVILSGGYHPYHAGHYALYQSAQRAFPDAEVYVAATDDRSTRPFPFVIKEKLAKLAGVEPGHFVQVKSPFRADEITKNYDPEQDTLIFVRSEKDADQPPRAGGVKKDGSPAYLQPLLGTKKLEPFGHHAYMAYLPVVEFGPGMTSATEIRSAWPNLNPKRKTALVMSLYPATQKNPKLADTVVKMLDTAIGSDIEEGLLRPEPSKILSVRDREGVITLTIQAPDGTPKQISNTNPNIIQQWLDRYGLRLPRSIEDKFVYEQDVEENTVGYIQEENPDYIEEKWSEKYKRSIDCSHPRGFSQRAHCAGRKK